MPNSMRIARKRNVHGVYEIIKKKCEIIKSLNLIPTPIYFPVWSPRNMITLYKLHRSIKVTDENFWKNKKCGLCFGTYGNYFVDWLKKYEDSNIKKYLDIKKYLVANFFFFHVWKQISYKRAPDWKVQSFLMSDKPPRCEWSSSGLNKKKKADTILIRR